MTVLLVDDEPQILAILAETLKAGGFTAHTCESGPEALDYLDNHAVELMVTDLRMPGMSGTDLLEEVRKRNNDLPVVFLTGFGDMKSAVDAMRLGAFDYLNKPVDAERLIQTVKRAAEYYRLVTENQTLIETLTEANRIKAQFLHGMSHEIRTPLGHITGFAEILESTLTDLSDKHERYLNNIQNAARRLLSMFDDMMQYVDLSSDDIPLSKDAFSLQNIIDKAQKPLADAIHTQSLSLNRQLPEASVITDETVCSKIAEVLLKNAVQFSPDNGKVTVSAHFHDEPHVPKDQRTNLIASPGDSWLHLSITDEGPGIDAEDHERILNVFVQLDGTLTRGHHATGMGLALAKNLAQRLNGCVTLKSAPDEGSTFTLVIPVIQS